MCEDEAKSSTLEILTPPCWFNLYAPSSPYGRCCEYQPRKELRRPAEQKVKGVPPLLQRGPTERCGGVASILTDKKKKRVRVCKGNCSRGARVDGENARATDLISEAGVGGFTCFVLRGQKIGCHPLLAWLNLHPTTQE
ncbi:hypothetical protein CRENBAI_013284, partial [Crenichthys baileyi]